MSDVDVGKCYTALSAAHEWALAGLQLGDVPGENRVLEYCEEVISEIKRAAAAQVVPPLEEEEENGVETPSGDGDE